MKMEVNAQEIIDIANTGGRIINPDNGKATYELVSLVITFFLFSRLGNKNFASIS
jgi:hypothetical protein